MFIAEEIDTMPIAEVKRDFYNIMNNVVMTYGDNQEETHEQCEQTSSPVHPLAQVQVAPADSYQLAFKRAILALFCATIETAWEALLYFPKRLLEA